MQAPSIGGVSVPRGNGSTVIRVRRGASRLQIRPHIVAHPGGVKVLNAYAESLGLDASALAHPRETLRSFGNMSSPSCLFVLERFLDNGDIAAGEHAVVMALGPCFSSVYVLVRGER